MGRYRRYATKTQGHKALIFRFYFLRVFVTSWQNITFETAPLFMQDLCHNTNIATMYNG